MLVAVTTLSFDISVLELFLPLAVGGTVVIVPRDVAMDGRHLKDALTRFGCNGDAGHAVDVAAPARGRVFRW